MLGGEGAEGRGLEYLYSTAATNATLDAGELPPSTLPYNAALDASGQDDGVRIVNGAVSSANAGGRVWYDTEQNTTAAEPWLLVLVRGITGQPARGDAPDAAWTPWSNVIYRKTHATDGASFLLESVWGAHTEDTLTADQMPLDSWTLDQITAGTTIDRGGVLWAKTLEESGFGLDKEYGFRADRQYDANQATEQTWAKIGTSCWTRTGASPGLRGC